MLINVINIDLFFQNDAPPPYNTVVVHSLPSLKSYDEVAYGTGADLVPPSQPYYIPRYPEPVIVAQVPEPGQFLAQIIRQKIRLWLMLNG